jgi:hypothetical protein
MSQREAEKTKPAERKTTSDGVRQLKALLEDAAEP